METIYYEKFGKGVPIIFIHGWMLDHKSLKNTFEPLFHKEEKLNATFQRIYIDLPGMGKSIISSESLNNETYMKLIACFIKRLVFNSKIILVGHSYGSYISLAIQKELNVIGLFLIAPVTIASRTQRTLPIHYENFFLDKLSYVSEEFTDFKINNFIISKENWMTYSKQILPAIYVANKKFCTYYESEHYISPNENKFFVNKNSCATTVIVGKNDNIVGFEDSLLFFQNFTNLYFLLINDCGHNIQIDQKNVLLNCFQNFIHSNLNVL